MKRNLVILLQLCLFFMQSVCVAGCSKKETPEVYRMTDIRVNKSALNLFVGEQFTITATPVPAVATAPHFIWKTSDASVAAVNNGVIHALKEGNAVITVSHGDIHTDIQVKVSAVAVPGNGILYNELLTVSTTHKDLLLNGVGEFTPEGLLIKKTTDVVKLNRFYAVAERVAIYKIRPSDDAQVLFRSSQGDFRAVIDIKNKKMSIMTQPTTNTTVDFLTGNREYMVEVYHIYQQAKVKITDVETQKSAEITAVNDGQGGCGKGALQAGFTVGMQWDHYCFGLAGGTSVLVKQITVKALKHNVKVLIYGDSISQPEGYYPTKDFPLSWTQSVITALSGDAMSCGRGGGNINMLLEYIKNELPYIKAKYVLVTIGTNGGNTEENLSELVNYIQSQGAIPILNNIPSNESGTQVKENKIIEAVRKKFNLKGCKFDWATSLHNDGLQVDKSLMYWEDYSGTYGWQIYHHPNEKGGQKMFERTKMDIPEIYQ